MAKKHEFIEKIKNYHCPRYNELPPFALYTDQLKELLELYLSEFEMPGEEKFITPTMISNYVKQKIIPPPVKKKYDRDHIVYLIVIGIFKQVLNISDIGAIIKMQRRFYPADIAYDYFCEELEAILKATFCTRDFSTLQKLEGAITLKELVRSSLLAFANKIYVKKKIYNRTQIISGKDGINK
jgi:hypothetical protein